MVTVLSYLHEQWLQRLVDSVKNFRNECRHCCSAEAKFSAQFTEVHTCTHRYTHVLLVSRNHAGYSYVRQEHSWMLNSTHCSAKVVMCSLLFVCMPVFHCL